jgi:hypothetical protein
VERAPKGGPQNEGEESGARLIDDGQRAVVCLAMLELAKKYEEFNINLS